MHEPWSGPALALIVACGRLKGGRSDWLIEKATELGAQSLSPLLTERCNTIGSSEKGDADDGPAQSGGRAARWSRVASSALKQSLRAHALNVTEGVSMTQLLEQIQHSDCLALVAAAGGKPIFQALSNASIQSNSYALP